MVRKFLAAIVAATALLPAGCCSLARLACDIEPPPAPAKGSRETPEAAVDFLIDAFRDRQQLALYESFSAEFKHENGDFSATEFTVAYEKAEAEFLADAESLAAAERRWHEPRGDTIVVELTNAATGAFFPIQFVNRPKLTIVTNDPFVAPIVTSVPMHDLVRLENGLLTLPPSFDLTKIEGVQKETLAGVTGANVVRVEIADDWLVRRIDTVHAKNIRFLDKIKEYAGK